MDPIGLIPAFLAMTEKNTPAERVRIAAIAAVTSLIILLLTFLVGQRLLSTFGITLPAFEIAGGIILLIVALDMLQAKRTAVKETTEEQTAGMEKHDVAVTPLAIPMLAGPGAITAVILLANQAESFAHHAILAASIFAVSALIFITFRFVASRTHLLSVIALKIACRLMGLLLAAIAIQFILNGLYASRIL